MTLPRLLAEIRERAENDASMRSDDFGHDCYRLLVYESAALQTQVDVVMRLVASLERAISQRDKYHMVTLLFNEKDHFERQQQANDAELAKLLGGV